MPANALLVKKWDRVFFKFFDLDGNGMVDWNDFEVFFDSVKKERGEDSVEFRFARDSMTMAWKGILNLIKGVDIADEIPKDIGISNDEWKKMWECTDMKHMPMWQWEYVKFMFLLLDSSGDKFIDESEYASMMKMFNMPEANSKAAFKKFAVHHRTGAPVEKIDYSMYVKRWGEYFTSTDANAPGNYLFGLLD